MKILVTAEASETRRAYTVSFEDLGITNSQWNLFNEKQRAGLLNAFLEQLPEHPYWTLYKYEER